MEIWLSVLSLCGLHVPIYFISSWISVPNRPTTLRMFLLFSMEIINAKEPAYEKVSHKNKSQTFFCHRFSVLTSGNIQFVLLLWFQYVQSLLSLFPMLYIFFSLSYIRETALAFKASLISIINVPYCACQHILTSDQNTAALENTEHIWTSCWVT